MFEQHYGLPASAIEALPGERDLNYLVATSQGRFVFKIANGSDADAFAATQRAALQRLRELAFVPRELDLVAGASRQVTLDGQHHPLRAVTYLPGRPLAEFKRPADALLVDLGGKLAQIDMGLRDFQAAELERTFAWNLRDGLDVIDALHARIEDGALRDRVQQVGARVRRRLESHGETLRWSAIHNDANDFNVLVGEERDVDGERSIAGIIDFGDMAWSYLIGELAIAGAYVVTRRQDRLHSVAALLRGYHAELPLLEEEVACLWELLLLRQAVSICMSEEQRRLRPEDPYLSISQGPIRGCLGELLDIPPPLAEAHLREACGWAPCRRSARVTEALATATAIHPVMGEAIGPDNGQCLDLGVTALDVPLTPQLDRLEPGPWPQPSARWGVGRYLEPRLIYRAPLFRQRSSRGTAEQRTVHLGLDLFAPAGAPVTCPLPGKLHARANNAAQGDYGGVLVLEHELGGETFFALYGHLAAASMIQVDRGAPVAAGRELGRLGTGEENGGWPPHLHLQLLVDDLGLGADFPGVALAEEAGVWASFSPDPAKLAGVAVAGSRYVDPAADALAQRAQVMGPSVRLSYRRPLAIARGAGAYLFDTQGRRYLDAYNNVPHVGHAHPHVVAAAHRQFQTLATNTRYLHGRVTSYCQRLADLFPAPLSVCYLLNSASEANELALRLARTVTGRTGVVVQAGAYHGHTGALIDVSPYKHAGPGGRGAPDWVHTLPLPDTFRGTHRGAEAASAYSREATQHIEAAAKSAYPPAALLLETCPSVAGQLVPPPGYLRAVYAATRAAGALVIADEVQTGFGRLGKCCWAFEDHDVVPDMVVLGKPMGNGYPLAAVVTTAEIARAFDNGMEFFSTFGGNTVAAEVGHAVLDVLETERLIERAQELGQTFRDELESLAQQFPLLGEVRGDGLFWGVDLVRGAGREAASREAALIVNRLRERGILLGRDGIENNVLKIRPPMVFDAGDLGHLVEQLARVLEEEFT